MQVEDFVIKVADVSYISNIKLRAVSLTLCSSTLGS
jgi:hypothetical protein